ncbi:MAG TPA: hypothetical protein VGR95_11165 [Thermoanaerobaculia bacterium]|jgi:hypothetical protein|nr:hypothetical protein [Thermoanaerobaculia bacterium]
MTTDSAAPAELSAAAVIQQIESGVVPREALLTFARGFLPLEQEDVIAVLAYLSLSDDAEVAVVAGTTLAEMPPRTLIGLASDESTAPEHLARLARATHENSVLEALIRNRALDDATVEQLALRADPQLQEVIVINQARILRAPQILDALLQNPNLSGDVRRRAIETREEFFDKKARLAEFIEEDLVDAPVEAIVDLLEAAAQEDANPQPQAQQSLVIPEGEGTDPKKEALFSRIVKMSVAQKVLLAFRGNRSTRLILVRERNRLVASAAIRNPRMTDGEAESIAGMRDVAEEVLRLIALRRDWMSKYPIVLALARNPRTPVGVVLPLINRLTLRDLKGLKDDRGVAEVVRATSRRMFQAKSKS